MEMELHVLIGIEEFPVSRIVHDNVNGYAEDSRYMHSYEIDDFYKGWQ